MIAFEKNKIIIIEFQRKTRLKGKKKKLTVVTCVVSTGMSTNEKSVAIQPHTSPTVAGFGFGGGGGTWGNETPPGGLAGTGRTGVKTGVKKTKTEDAVAERRTCFAEGE